MAISGPRRSARASTPALINALARAHRWKRLIESGRFASLTELAEAEKINRYLCRILRLTLLAPAGHQVAYCLNTHNGPLSEEYSGAAGVDPIVASELAGRAIAGDARLLGVMVVPSRLHSRTTMPSHLALS